MTIFNANLDASKTERKTLGQLRKELRKWEEVEQAQKARHGKEKPNNVDVNTYEVSHSGYLQ